MCQRRKNAWGYIQYIQSVNIFLILSVNFILKKNTPLVGSFKKKIVHKENQNQHIVHHVLPSYISPISAPTQQFMISLVNTDCYKSLPVQTWALFAKSLNLDLHEIKAHVEPEHQFYRRLMAVKCVFIKLMFKLFDVSQANWLKKQASWFYVG